MKKVFIGFIVGIITVLSFTNKTCGDELKIISNEKVTIESYIEFDTEPVDEYIYAMHGSIC